MNEKVLMNTFLGTSIFIFGGFTQFAFGILGVSALGITIITLGILESTGTINWGKYLPK